MFFFFFSSRRRHTRYWRDWSSDVCSSDLGADLILDNQGARLGGYHDGVDDLRQRVRVGRETRLAYDIRIVTSESRPNADRLVVQVTNREGKKLAVLERYTGEDRDGWRRRHVDLSRFAGRTVYVGFHVRT